MIAEMLAELLLLLTGDGRLPSATMHLRLERPQATMLARQLADHGPADGEPLRQPRVTPFTVFIRLHDPLPQIHRERAHLPFPPWNAHPYTPNLGYG